MQLGKQVIPNIKYQILNTKYLSISTGYKNLYDIV